MSKIHYGSTDVELELDVSAAYLDAEALRLLGVFHEIGAQVDEKNLAAAEARAMPAEEERLVAAAAAAEKPRPKTQGADYWRLQAEAREREAVLLAREQKAAGDAFEAYVLSEPSILARVAEALHEVHERHVASIAQASSDAAKLRDLAALHRRLAREAARASGSSKLDAEERARAVDDHFARSHAHDPGFATPPVLADAWATVGKPFPVDAYASTDPEVLVQNGRDLALRARHADPGRIETEEQRRQRLLANARATAKSAGQLSAEDVKTAADARRARNDAS